MALPESLKKIWITWEHQRRNISLSKALGAELYELNIKANSFIRYPLSLIKTLLIIRRERPAVIFAQNPSLVLAFFSVHYGKIFGIPVIIDAHNAGVFPLEGRNDWLNRLSRHIFRLSALTIVTNVALAEYVAAKGGRPFIFPDPLPELNHPGIKPATDAKKRILFICTWKEDEPYLEVIRAASLLDDEVLIYITGDSRGKEKEFGGSIPGNVVLTGYLREEDFVELLYSCDIVMDLTTRDNCLVCGAYEAVAAGKPSIISDSPALRRYFSKGALYTNNAHTDIAVKIQKAIECLSDLSREQREFKSELESSWDERKRNFEAVLSGPLENNSTS